MAGTGKGQGPLVADRRFGVPKTAARRSSPQPPPPKKPAPRRAAPQRKGGLIARFVGFIWRLVFSIVWRLTAIGALILGGIVFYFYAQLPPVSDLLDGRARGSVTLLDRGDAVFAWRGETFGGQITSENVSAHLLHAVVATEDKRFYGHFGVSPRGIASAIRINLSEGRGPLEGNGGSTITQQVAKLLCLGVPYDQAVWKSEADYEEDCRSGGVKRKLKEIPYAIAMEAKYSKAEILTIYFNRAYLGAGARGFEAVRKQYRRLAADNHPDRLMAQGLPEEAIAMANRKLALINDAYDRLRRQRGLVPA